MANLNPLPSPATEFAADRQPAKSLRRKASYSQALEWQRRLIDAAGKEGVTPHALAALARAWVEQEQIKRKIKGKADPKPFDVAALQESKRREMRRRQRRSEEFDGPVEAVVLPNSA